MTPKALISPAIALLLVLGLWTQISAYAKVDDTSGFHADVRNRMAEFPVRLGAWQGVEALVPPAAQKLLRPNVLFARRYSNETTGQRANLLVIHCQDARDMSGHYPPNCYPGSGWTMNAPPSDESMEVWGRRVPMVRYAFTRRDIQGSVNVTILNFFILPTGEFVTDMDSVRRASGDYRIRPYGAAQFQLVFDGSVSPEDQRAIAMELLPPLGPVVDVLTLKSAKR